MFYRENITNPYSIYEITTGKSFPTNENFYQRTITELNIEKSCNCNRKTMSIEERIKRIEDILAENKPLLAEIEVVLKIKGDNSLPTNTI